MILASPVLWCPFAIIISNRTQDNGTTIHDLIRLADSFPAMREYVYDKMGYYLMTSRPTAVNLTKTMT